jgi:hypothetical protein
VRLRPRLLELSLSDLVLGAEFEDIKRLVGQVIGMVLVTPKARLAIDLDLPRRPTVSDLEEDSANAQIGLCVVLEVLLLRLDGALHHDRDLLALELDVSVAAE